MTRPLCELEGTWEEIRAQVPDFSDRRLHVIILPAGEGTAAESPTDPRLAVLSEIEARNRMMNPKADACDYLREGRSGAMYGCEPEE